MAVEPRTFSVSGMTCSSCVNSIEKSLKEIDGVSASVNFATETVHILAAAEIKSSEIIKKIKSQGMTILLVEQNAAKALSVADRAYVLETGLITKEGSGQALLNDPAVRAAYLGHGA